MINGVSVITTLYNYKKYIGDAINSFKRQDLGNIEMIIVDDASEDNPYEIIDKAKKSDSRIKYIRLDTNVGYSRAKNIGIKESQYETITMLDADDMLTDNSISMRLIKINCGYDMVHGPALDLSDNKLSLSPLWKKWNKNNKKQTAYKCVHAQTVMLRKDVHRKIGLYDESLRSKSDREMWARIFNSGKFKIGFVDKPVAIYRMHTDQMHKSKNKLAINDRLQKEVEEKIERRKTDISDLEMLS